MIIVKLIGGLGNQMFQYAAGRRLAHKHNTQLLLDTTGFDNMAPGDTPRQFELDLYAITGAVATPDQLAQIQPPDTSRSFTDKIMRRLGMGKVWQYGERGATLDNTVLNLPNNTYLVGYWQNEQYFADIRATIVEEFTPKAALSDTNKKYLTDIGVGESVAVHVRRGDYVTNKNANVFHGLAPVDYYKQSIEYMRAKVKNPRFFVFSDDIAWCKKSLPLGKDAVFVEGNTGKQAFEDIRLMQHCKHNIIANSSFSWWGAWLNNNPAKLVIAPKMWFQDPEANKTEIVPPQWTRI